MIIVIGLYIRRLWDRMRQESELSHDSLSGSTYMARFLLFPHLTINRETCMIAFPNITYKLTVLRRFLYSNVERFAATNTSSLTVLQRSLVPAGPMSCASQHSSNQPLESDKAGVICLAATTYTDERDTFVDK
jgi:hypothetical protein